MFTLNRLLNELYKKKEWKRIEEIRTKFHIQIPVIDYKKVLASYNDFYFNINPVFYLHDRWKNSYNKDLLNTLIRIDLRNVEWIKEI